MTSRDLYHLLSLYRQFIAATKGPSAWIKNRIRAKSHKTLAGLLRKVI